MTPRQKLIHAAADRRIEIRKRAAERIGASSIGLRHVNPDDEDDRVRLHEAIEAMAQKVSSADEYLRALSDLAWTRLIGAVAREINRRMEVKKRARLARRRMKRRQHAHA